MACIGCATRTDAVSSANAANPRLRQTIDLQAGLQLRTVGTGAYEITHALPWPANSLLVEMADRTLVLVGTPYTPEATQRLLTWARSRFGERRIVAINNGFHVDNLGGNSALRAANIPVYGSDLTVSLLRERGEKTRQHILEMIGIRAAPAYAEHATIPYVPPDHVFPITGGLVLKFGTEEVQVIYPGPSQAPDKVVVFFPSRGLLYGGCMILSGNKVGNIADADLESWPRAVRTLAELPATVVIPGHGDRLDPNLIQNTLDVLTRANEAESGRR
jgi:glyoxylase-like metal-dependent hydrolase (beta-lactamase superfamily II)